MNSQFGYENPFFSMMNKIVDCFYASFLWIVFSLPIVTAGAASTAFYYTIHKCVRGSRGYVWQSFWSAFRSNGKQMTKIWLLMLGIFAFLFTDYRIMKIAMGHGKPFGILCYAFAALLLFWTAWCMYLFAYAARFENGIKDTMKNTAIFVLLHLPWSVLVLAVLTVCVLAVYLLPPLCLLVPAGAGCLYEIILERIFCRYMPKEALDKERM